MVCNGDGMNSSTTEPTPPKKQATIETIRSAIDRIPPDWHRRHREGVEALTHSLRAASQEVRRLSQDLVDCAGELPEPVLNEILGSLGYDELHEAIEEVANV